MADQPINIQFDQEGLKQQLGNLESYLKEEEKPLEEKLENIESEQEQAKATQEDPRDAEKWGFKALVKEGQSILSGGLQDTASSIATFPERTVDALSGEMAAERKTAEGYRPDWDPFTDYDNPIETKTWWGQLLRGAVHFGSMAVIPIAGWKGIAGKASYYATNSLVRAAGVGAVSDLISRESDGHNALGALRQRYSWIDTPITTKDTDHPVWMKFKNIVEGMGIGLAFDGLSIFLGQGSERVLKKVRARNKSIEDQTTEQAVAQMRRGDQEFRAEKNAPVAENHQGAHVSKEDSAWEVRERLARGREEWMSDDGSAGSVTTPAQRERVAMEANVSEELVEKTIRDLFSNSEAEKQVRDVKNKQLTLVETFGDAVLQHQRVTEGRNAAEMTAKEYLAELTKRKDFIEVGAEGVDEGTIEILTSRNVIATDLVIGTLLQQLRDTGIAGREIADIYNLMDKDGPTKQIADTLLTAMTMVKKARLVKSQTFRQLNAPGNRGTAFEAKRFLDETLRKEMVDSRESIAAILNLAGEEADGNLLMSLYEAFSQMKDVNSIDDFDAWARKMIKGGELNGIDRTGAAIRELEGVMIHSILSGPKTPMRAIMGTSTATFLRPISTFVGASMRYPFNGDVATVKASLASLNAMVQAIPEAFELFKSKLNSYWTGDISSVKSRFYEYTRGDDNWEVLRRWSEDSGRATFGDRAAFALANTARAMNMSNLFTYSTKLMAATDDAFAYILGRAKMREKAMRSALDLQEAGMIPDINPKALRKYEDDFYAEIFDADGNIIDEATKYARKEVTLTQELTGFAKGLNDVFSANPWAKPFFLFARTGVNGLSLTAKHTPGFNFFVKEFNDIAWANADNLDAVAKYGITSPEELINAKRLQEGRLAIGTGLITMASVAYISGNITGNGPVDRQKRQMWLDAGWKPRSIKVGGVWVGYDSVEPFNQILATLADVGDYSQLMGDEWTEKQLLSLGLIIGQGISSKSYLAGMQQFVDLVGARPGQAERIAAGILNNTVPLAGLRNDLGKLFTPYTRELGSGIDQAIRNRNLITENIAGEPLPIKYDMFDGRPIKDHDFLTRAYNMFSPVQLNLDPSPGKHLVWNSGYDLRQSTYYAPDGTNLTDEPEIRSNYQKAIGDQKPILTLNRLAKDPRMIASIAEMNKDIRDGNRGKFQAMDYYHNKVLKRYMDKWRKNAWARVRLQPSAQKVATLQQDAKLLRVRKTKQTTRPQGEFDTLLNMYK